MKFPAVLSVISLGIATIAIGNTQADYGRLNDYLVENVDSDDVAANMAAATTWLLEQQSKKHSFPLLAPIEDLTKFTSLQKVIFDDQCGWAAYEIMRANEQEVNLNRKTKQNELVRRVDKVIGEIFKKHAEKCLDVYPLRFELKVRQLEPTLLERVRVLTNQVVLIDRHLWLQDEDWYRMKSNANDLYLRFIDRPTTIELITRLSGLLNALNLSAKDLLTAKHSQRVTHQPSGKLIIRRAEIEQLVENYFIEPCQYYVDQLGQDLFLPAEFEAKFYHSVRDMNHDFYFGWAAFNICKVLIANKSAAVEHIVRSINKTP